MTFKLTNEMKQELITYYVEEQSPKPALEDIMWETCEVHGFRPVEDAIQDFFAEMTTCLRTHLVGIMTKDKNA